MAVLDFSRDIRVGCTVSLAPLAEEEEEGEVSEGEDGGPGLECFLFSFVFPPYFPWCFPSFGGIGMIEIRAPCYGEYFGLGQDMDICRSNTVAAEAAAELPWPFGPYIAR